MDIADKIGQYKRSLSDEKNTLFRNNMVCKLTGVTFENRQEVLHLIEKNTPLKLQRERNNTYDFHAIKVLAFVNDEWKGAGYVTKGTNEIISYTMDCGIELDVDVEDRLGNPDRGYNYGLMVTIKRRND